MSQENLAYRAAIHRTQISLIEGGRRQPRLETLVKLAGSLEVPVSALIEGIVWEPLVEDSGGFKVSDPPELPRLTSDSS